MRLALIGWGAIGQATAARLGPDVEIVAVGVRSPGERTSVPATARIITDPAELEACSPDVVAEAAGRDSVAPWGRAALEVSADLIVSSVSAFAEVSLLDDLQALAAARGARIQIQLGALAGVDALAAARPMGIESVTHRIVKPPRAWRGTPAETRCDLGALATATVFYEASAAQTAREFPKNANVAMTPALAGVGPDDTQVVLVADPGATTNRHEISARGGFGTLDVRIDNHALPENPKTSAMAALGLVRAIENRTSTIII